MPCHICHTQRIADHILRRALSTQVIPGPSQVPGLTVCDPLAMVAMVAMAAARSVASAISIGNIAPRLRPQIPIIRDTM